MTSALSSPWLCNLVRNSSGVSLKPSALLAISNSKLGLICLTEVKNPFSLPLTNCALPLLSRSLKKSEAARVDISLSFKKFCTSLPTNSVEPIVATKSAVSFAE